MNEAFIFVKGNRKETYVFFAGVNVDGQVMLRNSLSMNIVSLTSETWCEYSLTKLNVVHVYCAWAGYEFKSDTILKMCLVGILHLELQGRPV